MGQLSHHHQAAIQRHEAVVVVGEKFCDFCKPVRLIVAEVDGKTTHGPWANMCEEHFERHGVGLGLGRGQRLIYQEYDPTKKEQ